MAGNFNVAYDPTQVSNNAFLKGALAAQALGQVQAQQKAATQFDPANTAASQATLNGAGLYDQANALQDRPLELQKTQLGVQQQQQTLDNGAQDQTHQNDSAEWKKAADVAGLLNNVKRQGGDVLGTFDSMSGYLQKELGLDPEHFAAIRDQVANNPGFLDAITENANKVIGGSLVDTNTGDVKFDGRSKTAGGKPQIVYGFDDQGNKVAYEVQTDDNGNHSLTPIPVGAAAGASSAPLPGPTGGLTEETFASQLKSLVPGAVISSGLRSAEHNKAVGGVDNSNHLTGQAADVVPPPGMSMEQLDASLKSQGFHTINEKDHVHVDFNKSSAGAPGAASAGQFSLGKSVKQSADGDLASPLGQKDLDYMAKQYAITGSLPSLGSGKIAAQARLDVIHTAVNNYGDQLDAGRAKADYDAAKTSLTDISKKTTTSRGFERAANAAADLVGTFQKAGIGKTGQPLIDGPLFNLRIQSGDADALAYKNAIGTFAEEYAKVMAGANGSAAATDSARSEAHSRLDTAFTKKQVDTAIGGLKLEMKRRIEALDANVEDARGRVPSNTSKSAATGGKRPLSDIFGGL